jgi:hypothetical protein
MGGESGGQNKTEGFLHGDSLPRKAIAANRKPARRSFPLLHLPQLPNFRAL